MYRYARINMSTGNVRVFDLPRERWILGGRGLISQVLYTEMNPGADPLSSGNVLVLASGMFAGCPLSCFDSLFLGAKSSSTGQLQILRFMSRGARIMASMNMRFAIIEGRPAVEKQYVLVLDRGRVSLLPATELLPDFREELGSYAINEGLQRHFGGNACVVSCGHAAVVKSPEASLLVSGSSGNVLKNIPGLGLSTVMFSKGLRAIVLRGGVPHAPQKASNDRADSICRDTACLLRCARIHNDLEQTPYGQVSLCRACLGTPKPLCLERVCTDLGLSPDGLSPEFGTRSLSDEDSLRTLLLERCRQKHADTQPLPSRREVLSDEQAGAAFDSMGLCRNALPPEEQERTLTLMAELACAVYGGEWSKDRLLRMGEETLHREKAFNDWAGLQPAENE